MPIFGLKLNFPLPIPCTSGSRPFRYNSRLFAIFLLQNITQRCKIFLSHFSMFSLPWISRSPPPPIDFQPPLLPVFGPVPLSTLKQMSSPRTLTSMIGCCSRASNNQSETRISVMWNFAARIADVSLLHGESK